MAIESKICTLIKNTAINSKGSTYFLTQISSQGIHGSEWKKHLNLNGITSYFYALTPSQRETERERERERDRDRDRDRERQREKERQRETDQEAPLNSNVLRFL